MKLEDAAILSEELMSRHGLRELGWQFRFDKATRRFGLCDYQNRLIQLAKPLVEINPERAVTNTILHEIAHALVGPFHGHDEIWRAKAIQIGCDGKRCHNDHLPIHNARAVGICPNCYTLRPASRFPSKITACAECCRKFNSNRYSESFRFQWKLRGEPFDINLPTGFLPADKLVIFIYTSPSIFNPHAVRWCLNRNRFPAAVYIQTEYLTEQLTRDWARDWRVPVVTCNGSYATYPKHFKPFAATLFNRTRDEILSRADLLIAIWDGNCSASRRLIAQTVEAGKPATVFNFEKKKITNLNFEKNNILKSLKVF